jgi:multidrug transporter EmrE-like cation transporter
MRKSGVSVTGAVVQVSLMLPVAVAIWRFREYPNGYQIAGMLLTLVALPLLSASTAVHASGGVPARFSPLTLVLFFSTGASQVVMKEFAGTRPEAELPLYSAALFAAATFFTYLWMALSGDTGQATAPPEDAGNGGTPDGKLIPESLIGVALGLINVLQLLFLLRALHSLPAVVVFPVSAALGITANVLASVLLWKERPPMAGWIGIALAIAAVVLLNLK